MSDDLTRLLQNLYTATFERVETKQNRPYRDAVTVTETVVVVDEVGTEAFTATPVYRGSEISQGLAVRTFHYGACQYS